MQVVLLTLVILHFGSCSPIVFNEFVDDDSQESFLALECSDFQDGFKWEGCKWNIGEQLICSYEKYQTRLGNVSCHSEMAFIDYNSLADRICPIIVPKSKVNVSLLECQIEALDDQMKVELIPNPSTTLILNSDNTSVEIICLISNVHNPPLVSLTSDNEEIFIEESKRVIDNKSHLLKIFIQYFVNVTTTSNKEFHIDFNIFEPENYTERYTIRYENGNRNQNVEDGMSVGIILIIILVPCLVIAISICMCLRYKRHLSRFTRKLFKGSSNDIYRQTSQQLFDSQQSTGSKWKNNLHNKSSKLAVYMFRRNLKKQVCNQSNANVSIIYPLETSTSGSIDNVNFELNEYDDDASKVNSNNFQEHNFGFNGLIKDSNDEGHDEIDTTDQMMSLEPTNISCTVRVDFNPECYKIPGLLKISQSESLMIIHKDLGSGWTFVRNGQGKVGFVPSNILNIRL